jgi:hypothetical protein
MTRPNAALCWFDWEHCGLRSSSDDLVWLLADEWSPPSPKVENDALLECADQSSQFLSKIRASFYTMGVLHSFYRLALIVNRKGLGPWWDHAECLKLDRIGVTRGHVKRLCDRGIRWSEHASHLTPFRPLFAKIPDALDR